MRFRSYVDGCERFMGPETSMEVQAALGSDIALAFDECTPFHVTRDYTARSTERTHRWLDRCLDWHARARPAGPGRLRHRPGRRGRGPAARVGAGGRRAADVRRHRDRRLARRRTRRRCTRWSAGRREELPEERPRHLLGIGDVDDLIARRRARHRHVRLRDAHAPRPPRHGARARPRGRAGGSTSPRARYREADEPILDGCPCRGLRGRLLARLPALPPPASASRPARACSRCTTSPSCAADGRPARRDRRRPAGRARPRRRSAPAPRPWRRARG